MALLWHPEEDIKRTIDGMELKPDGSPMKMLKEEEYRKHTEWQNAPEEEVRGIVKNYQR